MKSKSSCLYCKKTTLKRPDVIRRGYGQFCSHSCSSKYQWEQYRLNKPITRCGYCKNIYQQKRRKQKYCSYSCAAKARPSPPPNNGNFIKGHTTWNKGLKGYRLGHEVTKETRDKIAKANSGPNAPNWKGGISEENYRIRRSAAYKEWRTLVFKRDDYTCQICGDRSRKGHRIVIHADHIKPFALHKELRFDVSNGRTLCEDCHRKTPTYGSRAMYLAKA